MAILQVLGLQAEVAVLQELALWQVVAFLVAVLRAVALQVVVLTVAGLQVKVLQAEVL